MIKPIIKKGRDLTTREYKELMDLCRLAVPTASDDFLRTHHIEKTDPFFYLYKIDQKIVAFVALVMFWAETPFSKKKLPIFFVNLTLKKENVDQYIKNFSKHAVVHFGKSQIGIFWFLKKYVFIVQTFNPKLVERLSAFFPMCFPKVESQPSIEIHQFVKSIFVDYS